MTIVRYERCNVDDLERTIGNSCSFGKVMLNGEAFRLCVFGIVVRSVCDEDLLIRNTSVTKVLSLCCSLVSETKVILVSGLRLDNLQRTQGRRWSGP